MQPSLRTMSAAPQSPSALTGMVRRTPPESGADISSGSRSRDLDLAEEAIAPECGREIGAQDLHGHAPAVFEVLRQVDRSHATLADLTIDAVAHGQRGAEPVEVLAHSAPAATSRSAFWMSTSRGVCGRRTMTILPSAATS